jgi:S-adenosylmethionine-diacylglycerol 3-amino-3-carboxypropyl transferase
MFRAVHGNHLVYNTCLEDPALDRVALQLRPDDRLLVITSAGCNALDYLLTGPAQINAVDINPRQSALLELKVAGIRALDHASFFALFGRGFAPDARHVYRESLRPLLSEPARAFWDRHIFYFQGRGWRKSFYYHGTAGLVCKVLLTYLRLVHRLGGSIDALLQAQTIDEQRAIYEGQMRDRLLKPWLLWFLSRPATQSLLGAPWTQLNQVTTHYPGGMAGLMRDCVEAVMARLPFQDNYFYRVYLQGHYTPECCPEYLKPDNFKHLKAGLVDRLNIATASVTNFLRQAEPGLSKFVLLDHMDWMSRDNPQALADEWNAILDKARPGARVIFRSAGLRVDFLDRLPVLYRGQHTELGRLLHYQRELAAELHARDRVHVYSSFHIVDLPDEPEA